MKDGKTHTFKQEEDADKRGKCEAIMLNLHEVAFPLRFKNSDEIPSGVSGTLLLSLQIASELS